MPIFETPRGRVLFIHVPKTGGSTIEFELAQHHQISMISNSVWPGYQSIPQHLHSGPLTELFRSDEFVYAFLVVRNPVDRIYSEYNWNQRNRSIKVPFWIWLRVKFRQVRNSPYLMTIICGLRRNSCATMPKFSDWKMDSTRFFSAWVKLPA